LRKAKPYIKPPKDRCELCHTHLFSKVRYKVRLYMRGKPFRDVVFKELVVCGDCLRKLLSDEGLKGFRVRYRKMRPLRIGWWVRE